jgi:hypothetical protein
MIKSSSTLLLALVLAFSGCGTREQSETTTSVDTTTNIPAGSTVNAIEEVASDPEKLRQALLIAETKGTLLTSLTEAAKDSVIRDRMRAALTASAGAVQNASATKRPARKSATGTKDSRDGLDQADDALTRAGRTIDRTTDVVNKAAEVNKKADDLLRGRR